jgi:predicted dienelactone hydrolase
MMKRTLLLLLVAVTAACASNSPSPSSTPQVATTTYRSDSSPNPVGAIPSALLHDSKRNKNLEMVIEYPTRGGPYPVIIFSHGYGGSKDSYIALTEYWTAQGYVCIKPNHADAGALRTLLDQRREEMMKRREEMRQQGRQRSRQRPQGTREGPDLSEVLWQSQTATDWKNRAQDITLVIDSLDQLEQKYPELVGKMDHAKIGVAGHSYGALTAMLLAGARSSAETPAIDVTDARVKAVIAMSPQGMDPHLGLTAESWANVRKPMLFITGSNDRSGQAHDAAWRRDPFVNSPAGDKYFISIEGAGHMSFAGGQGFDEDVAMIPDRSYGGYGQRNPTYGSAPRPGYQGMESGRRPFDAIKMSTLAFWDAYLKSDAKGRDYLNGPANTLNGGRITIEKK